VLSCNTRRDSSSNNTANPAENDLPADTIKYAKGFSVTAFDGYTEVEVKDPWNKGKLLQRYLLVSRDRAIPENLPAGTVVRVPARNVVVYTSIHCSLLDEIGAGDIITGVCESRHIKSENIKSRILEGSISDLGESTSPNVEKMIEIGAEMVLASPFNNSGYGSVEKTGIPVVECADYMENTPLGQAEWIKFLGLICCKTQTADSLFNVSETKYNDLKMLTNNITGRPTVFPDLKYGATWYMPGGESYIAQLFKDAGADYVFAYLPGTGSYGLNFETVLDKAINADLWLIKYNQGNDFTYESLKADYLPYSNFDAFKNRSIYGCNTYYSCYYEEKNLHPDYLLANLIALFHPGLLPDYKSRYYFPLK
jgi:iron complex transport system substrate-binding protein